MAVQIYFGDGETVFCPEKVVRELLVISELVNFSVTSDRISIEDRSGRLFRQVVDFFLYPKGTITLTPALIAELDFYGYNIVPENLPAPRIKKLIDFFQEQRSLRREVLTRPELSISLPVDFVTKAGESWKKFFNWNLSISYREIIREISKEIAKVKGELSVLGVPLQYGYWDDFESKLNVAYQGLLFEIIAEERAFLLRLILIGFYLIADQGFYQHILMELIGQSRI